MSEKYMPIDDVSDMRNIIVGLFCIANELATLNREGITCHHPK